jgi:hypothetical protein
MLRARAPRVLQPEHRKGVVLERRKVREHRKLLEHRKVLEQEPEELEEAEVAVGSVEGPRLRPNPVPRT